MILSGGCDVRIGWPKVMEFWPFSVCDGSSTKQCVMRWHVMHHVVVGGEVLEQEATQVNEISQEALRIEGRPASFSCPNRPQVGRGKREEERSREGEEMGDHPITLPPPFAVNCSLLLPRNGGCRALHTVTCSLRVFPYIDMCT